MIVAPYPPKQQHLAREIRWIQDSPPILGPAASPKLIQQPIPEFCSDITTDYWLTTNLTDGQPPPIGIHYERLWRHILEHVPETRLIAHNLQVRTPHKTLGEFDLIYRNEATGEYYHRELALKFYLGLPYPNGKPSPWNYWVGPGLKDRLDIKAGYLLHQQSHLSQTPEGQHTLSTLGISRIQPEILLQGYLFYPAFTQTAPPLHGHTKHLRAQWLNISRLNTWLKARSTATHYMILPKYLWLCPFHGPLTVSDIYTGQRLAAHLRIQLTNDAKPKLIAAGIYEKSAFKEVSRLFVVPDPWQEKALEMANSN